MREITILNPTAGKGRAEGADCYVTKGAGDCRRFVREECEKDPFVHFNVVGGDGTLNEAVSGIMDAGAGKTASVTAIPCGSGNDTVKTTDTYEKGSELAVDLIKAGDGIWSINMINIGFDCNVVERASRYKRIKGVSGNFSYILGVLREFFSKFGVPFRITAELEDGSAFEYEEDSLLCAIANGQWCGGSFHNSPMSDMTDGTVEMILVRKMSRLNFIKMIGKYKKGTLICEEHGGVDPKYRDWVIFRRIKKMTISGCRQICTDGEVLPCERAEIGVAPGAIRYIVGGAEHVPETV
ncbi:MAG: hypothetical protein IKN36_04470 [Clostridia bacterium]|nr:hypothetical protein [Clostridia bacterium]